MLYDWQRQRDPGQAPPSTTLIAAGSRAAPEPTIKLLTGHGHVLFYQLDVSRENEFTMALVIFSVVMVKSIGYNCDARRLTVVARLVLTVTLPSLIAYGHERFTYDYRV